MAAVRDQVAQLRGEPAPEEFYVAPRRYVDKPTSIRPSDAA